MTNERAVDATTPKTDEEIKDLASAETSEENVRGGTSTQFTPVPIPSPRLFSSGGDRPSES